jgi:putative NADH-flavin reductase
MNIIVFGATGGVGQQVVKQALEEGFKVTAFVRNPNKLEVTHERLAVVQGDAFQPAEVAAAIAGHDAVVSCLGSSQGMRPSTELEQMTKHIVDGMKQHQVKRIVYTASAGIDRELPGISGKLIMYMLRHAPKDHKAAVDYILRHDLDYTIVRPLGLTNKPFTGQYREAATGVPEKSMSIPRADVAHFIIKALQDTRYVRTSVGLAT